jgi:3-methyl-2-oxobutanoate hydroxymethyltransferase
MGHIGLTPQSVHQLGGFRVQGKDDADAGRLLRQAHVLEELGCFAIVLECVPAWLAAQVTLELTVPTIGIGAGAATDGQVLVLQDLWGVTDGHRYDDDVKGMTFPAPEESYS